MQWNNENILSPDWWVWAFRLVASPGLPYNTTIFVC